MNDQLSYLCSVLIVTFLYMIAKSVGYMVSSRQLRAIPERRMSEAEMDAILEEPIEQTICRGENVALKEYAQPLFSLMASYCPPVQPVRRTLVLPPGSQAEYRSYGPTGASVACVSASVATFQAGGISLDELRSALEKVHVA